MTIEDLMIVLKVAEFKNITAAAESLNMRTATASAALKRVERQLGVELFSRTTRRLKLSSAGERFIPRCREGIHTLEIARQEMLSETNVIRGELKLSAPSDLGRNILLPWLDEFTTTYDQIKLNLHIADRNIDFYRDPVDVAIRYGALTDENLYGFKICNVRRVLCASPEYVKKFGAPHKPADISKHNALLYQLHELIDDEWCFTKKDKSYKVKTKSTKVSNDADLVRRWCLSGQGLAKKSSLDMSTALLDGDVIRLMPEFEPTPTELWLVCPSRQTITPAVRLLRDFLREKCEHVIKSLVAKNVF